MPLISVPAVYDGTNIALLEKPPSRTPYHVLVTFVEPIDNMANLWSEFFSRRLLHR